MSLDFHSLHFYLVNHLILVNFELMILLPLSQVLKSQTSTKTSVLLHATLRLELRASDIVGKPPSP